MVKSEKNGTELVTIPGWYGSDEDDVRGAVATTDDDDDEVASSLDRGSIGTLDQIDELMRKASRETPTPPADETGKLLGQQHIEFRPQFSNAERFWHSHEIGILR